MYQTNQRLHRNVAFVVVTAQYKGILSSQTIKLNICGTFTQHGNGTGIGTETKLKA